MKKYGLLVSALFLTALTCEACSWIMPVRVHEPENQDHLVGCRSNPAIADTTATAIEVTVATVLLAAAASAPASTDEEFGSMFKGYGTGVVALGMIGIGAIQGASAITGWARYRRCSEDMTKADIVPLTSLVPPPTLGLSSVTPAPSPIAAQ